MTKNTSRKIEELERQVQSAKFGGLFLGFSALCFLTSLFMNMDVGSSIKGKFDMSGGLVGPIEVPTDYAVYDITIKQPLSFYGTWSFVGGDVLNQDQEYLFGFGKELWKEQGVDYEGYAWAEEETAYDLKVTFPQQGTYFLRMNIETNKPSSAQPVQVAVVPKRGSSLAHFILGVLALIGSIGLWVWLCGSSAPTDRLGWSLLDD